jgi:4-carboxymuconolactone decarboxylase
MRLAVGTLSILDPHLDPLRESRVSRSSKKAAPGRRLPVEAARRRDAYPLAIRVARLPAPDRNDLPPEDQAVWDRIAAVQGGVRGPFGVLMHVPRLADRVRAVEDYFRFDGDLPAADRELVILVTAREMEARYAWARHEHRAHEEGTPQEAVNAVRSNGPLDGLTKRDRLLIEITRALLRTRKLTDTQYAEAVAELGVPQLIELVALAGHYSLIGLTLGAFDVTPPDDLRASYTF